MLTQEILAMDWPSNGGSLEVAIGSEISAQAWYCKSQAIFGKSWSGSHISTTWQVNIPAELVDMLARVFDGGKVLLTY